MSSHVKIKAQGLEVSLLSDSKNADYVSLTDIARYRSVAPKTTIQNWMRNRDVIEFLGLWERLRNPGFKGIEFEAFKQEAGRNAFVLSPRQWIERTGAIGLTSRSGRYGGGTYAHTDIAFEFASWISPEFKLYLITDYQRLKGEEHERASVEWSVTRELSKINYLIHTDAVKQRLVPEELDERHRSMVYAHEADVLNVALFGCTAAEWRQCFPKARGNMRDHANLYQLIVLSNLESYNAELVKGGVDQGKRLELLNAAAREQLTLLLRYSATDGLLGSGGAAKGLDDGEGSEEGTAGSIDDPVIE